jgi:hypothetical protein
MIASVLSTDTVTQALTGCSLSTVSLYVSVTSQLTVYLFSTQHAVLKRKLCNWDGYVFIVMLEKIIQCTIKIMRLKDSIILQTVFVYS